MNFETEVIIISHLKGGCIVLKTTTKDNSCDYKARQPANCSFMHLSKEGDRFREIEGKRDHHSQHNSCMFSSSKGYLAGFRLLKMQSSIMTSFHLPQYNLGQMSRNPDLHIFLFNYLCVKGGQVVWTEYHLQSKGTVIYFKLQTGPEFHFKTDIEVFRNISSLKDFYNRLCLGEHEDSTQSGSQQMLFSL